MLYGFKVGNEACHETLLGVVAAKKPVDALSVDRRLSQGLYGSLHLLQGLKPIAVGVGHGVVVDDGVLYRLVVVGAVVDEVSHLTVVELMAVEVVLDSVGDVLDVVHVVALEMVS